MKLILTLILLITSVHAIAQKSGIYYYDETFELTSKENAQYIEEIEIRSYIPATKKTDEILQWYMTLWDNEGNKIREGLFNHGQADGDWYFYTDGILSKKTQFLLGGKDGIEEEYYNSGAIKASVEYTIGVVLNSEIAYYESGEIQGKKDYSHGRPEGISHTFYRDGSIETERMYHEGFVIGEVVTFYNSGQRKIVSEKRRDEPDIKTEYYESGEVRSEKRTTNHQINSFKLFYEKGELLINEYYDETGKGREETYLKTGELVKVEYYKNWELDSVSNLIDTSFTNIHLEDTLNITADSNEALYEVFSVVDQMPIFINEECMKGKKADLVSCSQWGLMQYLGKVSYPSYAINHDMQDKIFMRFLINDEGYVVNVEVANSSKNYSILTEWALRHVSVMPRWEPGSQKGKKVQVQYVVPIHFKLG